MQELPYRDYNGWLIPANKKCYIKREGDDPRKRKQAFDEIKATHVYCPRENTLMHLNYCSRCVFFVGLGSRVLYCQSNGTYTAPEWYNETKQ